MQGKASVWNAVWSAVQQIFSPKNVTRDSSGQATGQEAAPREPAISWAKLEQGTNPQALLFMSDLLPYIRRLNNENVNEPSNTWIAILDFGTGAGAGANFLAQMNYSSYLGSPMAVDAMDFFPIFKEHSLAHHPYIREYIVGDILTYEPHRKWEGIICSHVIEHLEDPRTIINELRRRATKWVLLYAPYNESPRIEGHIQTITDEFVDSFSPVFKEVITSFGWRSPFYKDAKCIVFALSPLQDI